jgi:hypothetical protein
LVAGIGSDIMNMAAGSTKLRRVGVCRAIPADFPLTDLPPASAAALIASCRIR